VPVEWNRIEPLLMQVEKTRALCRRPNGIRSSSPRPPRAPAWRFPISTRSGCPTTLRILYERINARREWAAERMFTPGSISRRSCAARASRSIRSRRDARSRNSIGIGFTLQHETNYTNILNMIDLGGLPI